MLALGRRATLAALRQLGQGRGELRRLLQSHGVRGDLNQFAVRFGPLEPHADVDGGGLGGLEGELGQPGRDRLGEHLGAFDHDRPAPVFAEPLRLQ
jgi:hypothetical protein